jgi:hypothetical protein
MQAFWLVFLNNCFDYERNPEILTSLLLFFRPKNSFAYKKSPKPEKLRLPSTFRRKSKKRGQ